MIYKFENRVINVGNSYLELLTENGHLKIISADYDVDLICNVIYLKSEDIDDLIVALTSLKNKISE